MNKPRMLQALHTRQNTYDYYAKTTKNKNKNKK